MATKKTTRRAPATAAAKRAPAKAAKKSAPARAGKPRAARPAARGNGAAAPVPVAKPADTAPKAAKLKLVRDSFTIPRDEYGAIDALKLRAAKLGRITKKSELLRAGLKLLAACGDAGLLGALDAVPPVKTGRPKAKRHGKEESAGSAAAARDA
jgi:hypothetical protein